MAVCSRGHWRFEANSSKLTSYNHECLADKPRISPRFPLSHPHLLKQPNPPTPSKTKALVWAYRPQAFEKAARKAKSRGARIGLHPTSRVRRVPSQVHRPGGALPDGSDTRPAGDDSQPAGRFLEVLGSAPPKWESGMALAFFGQTWETDLWTGKLLA